MLPWIVAFTLGSLVVAELVPAVATLWDEIAKTDIPSEADLPLAAAA